MNEHKTAITRKAPSLPMQYLHGEGLLLGEMLDYGCGKGFDASHYSMDKYDPYYTGGEVITPTGGTILIEKQYDTITCNYVMNVIEDVGARNLAINDVWSRLKSGGVAYFAVRRDSQVAEGVTKTGTYQSAVELCLPVETEKKGKYIIYRFEKE